MKWFVTDVLLTLWFLPFFFVLVIAASITNRPAGQLDHSTQHEARIAEAHAREAEARAAEARGIALGVAHKAWAGNMPLILLVLAGGAVVAISAIYRGKATVEMVKQSGQLQVTQAKQLEQPTTVNQNLMINVMPDEAMRMLQQYAQANNKRIEQSQGQYFLVDNATGQTQRVKPKQITG